ncbi:hypothetical protein HID58_017879 [Brassica napus]|uniref:Uncharacterized protein n=1 Tax=Brassica napus TaxID=3708 RepID=A0ABQ8D8T3_BRANA|nr:hypothetical protein HID58_017879 [Brassica napus]
MSLLHVALALSISKYRSTAMLTVDTATVVLLGVTGKELTGRQASELMDAYLEGSYSPTAFTSLTI